ncbi:MbnP family protein [Xanthovirga aplysinae]|uniref:MbnP family protein n=1 Tax=Xanthovirga aplysinae TaxID=2529853 RepID=UPI0012BD0E95|nr:MbnP family protein [Xanthovirga aplysinae]MTI32664.1 hypothetical protein [Xanthovirga aplysinae]
MHSLFNCPKLSFRKLSLFSALIFLFSCQSEKPTREQLWIHIYHTINNEPLLINDMPYENALGQQYFVTDLKYYISNLTFIDNEEQTEYTLNESYHLVHVVGPEEYLIKLNDLPVGEFDQIRFSLGIDSLANKNIDQLGALDPANEMIWDWETGYKFLSFNGVYFPEQGDGKELIFHVGKDENYKELVFNLDPLEVPVLRVEEERYYDFYLSAHFDDLFKNPHTINFRTFSNTHDDSQLMDNFSHGVFTLDKIEIR